MPIHLACHGCGASFAVPDALAGKHGKCKHCKMPLRVPPADDPVLIIDADDRLISLSAKRVRRYSISSYLGAIAAISAIAVLVAILLTTKSDPQSAKLLLGFLGLAVTLSAPLITLVLFPVLSRAGVLSVSRWLIMAAFCGSIAAISFLSLLAFQESMRGENPDDYPLLAWLITISSWLVLVSVLGVPGSLLAAAVYPKERAPAGDTVRLRWLGCPRWGAGGRGPSFPR